MSSSPKKKFFIIGLIFSLSVVIAVGILFNQANTHNTNQIIIERVKLQSNEHIRLAHAPKPEKGLVLFLGEKNNAKANEDYARKFAALSYYVAIIDDHLLLNSSNHKPDQCLNLAKQITAIGDQLQTHFKLNAAELPILVGVEDGAATSYAALAQAEKQKFHAAVGINLSTDLKLTANLCSLENVKTSAQGDSQVLAPVNRLPASFYVFQDKNTSNTASKEFTDKIGNLKLTQEDDKEHALSEAIQILQWLDPRLTDQRSSDTSDSDLPIIEVPVDEKATTQKSTLVVLITGDGGWAAIDKNIAKILAAQGIPTVALDALSYFWKARTPEETTRDVESIIGQYLEKWNKKDVILIGYSFGADVLPFIANNLTDESKKQLALVALLGMGKTAAFEFRLSSWMNADKSSSRLPILPEIQKMKWANTICIYGLDDTSANCLPTVEMGVKAISMPGDHHFNEKYEDLVQHILDNVKPPQ
ncbi:MAG: AcvB/VirJ family lysyl-phosphatidylglycerol hydrolase [Cellvibrio sp.]